MISANCLVFPKPAVADSHSIQKHLVYIPKDIKCKHFYSSEKAIDDLSSTSSPTARSVSDLSTNFFKFKIISSIRTKKKYSASYIPCVFLKGSYYENKLIIYFHSNAEDIISAFHFAQAINISCGRSVLMMQYPGYSIYKKKNCSFTKENSYLHHDYEETTAEDIQNDSKKVLQYMKEVVGFNLKDITVMGRSIGSGPAVYLGSIYPVGSVILLSPFLSIKQAVKDLYGQICSRIIKQRFNNKQRIKLIESPCLIIHGLQDSIISYKHAVGLNKQIKTFSTLKLIEKMKHNCFNFHKDFILHVKDFFRNVEVKQ